MYSRKGSLFIPNFKRKEITHDAYFASVIHYIHNNPVHHDFVKESTDWPWSSYHAMLLDKVTSIKREEVLAWFGNRHEFIKFHQQPLDIKMKLEMDF